MSFDLKRSLRNFKPGKRRERLRPRSLSELSFITISSELPRKVLYDTTVYIDVLHNRFPQGAELLLRSTDAWHSTVTESEMAAGCGLLDPAHPGTRDVVEKIMEVIRRRPAHRTIAPDREIWFEAGILSGTLARLQGYMAPQRRRVLNDALLFATARKYGLTVLTRNVRDFDLLQQLEPAGRLSFYAVQEMSTI